jgi:hypothetical protein
MNEEKTRSDHSSYKRDNAFEFTLVLHVSFSFHFLAARRTTTEGKKSNDHPSSSSCPEKEKNQSLVCGKK